MLRRWNVGVGVRGLEAATETDASALAADRECVADKKLWSTTPDT